LNFQDGADNITQETDLVNHQKLFFYQWTFFANAISRGLEYSWSKSSNWRFIFLTNLNKINAD
jgi:hypothetical protein